MEINHGDIENTEQKDVSRSLTTIFFKRVRDTASLF